MPNTVAEKDGFRIDAADDSYALVRPDGHASEIHGPGELTKEFWTKNKIGNTVASTDLPDLLDQLIASERNVIDVPLGE